MTDKSRQKNPYLYPGTRHPFLLDTTEFSVLSKVPEGSSTMHRVRNRMDVVLVGPQKPRRQPTVRQPLPYALGLAEALKRRSGDQIARIAMDYSRSDEAHDRIREGRAYFKQLLDDHTQDGFVYSGDATGILNLWPEAVYHWQRTGVLFGDEVAKGVGGDERELFITRSALERLCVWRLPEAVRDTGIPDLPYPPQPQDPSFE